jgi:hypothetical protein
MDEWREGKGKGRIGITGIEGREERRRGYKICNA